MPLSTQDLADLRARVMYAHHRGFGIAKAADYVAALGGGAPPEGVEEGSTAHLLALLDGEVKSEPPPTLMSGMSAKQAKRAAAEKAAAEKAAAEKAAEAAAAVQEVVAVKEAVAVEVEAKADEKP